jgi:hypothetical protein
MKEIKIPMNDYIERQKDINFLLSFSCDIIASYSLLKDYDVRHVAWAIDRLFGYNPSLEEQKEICKPNKNVKVPKYDLLTEGYDPNKLPK